MNTATTFWMSALAMTLVHSLWQAAGISLIANTLLRIGKIEKASSRYVVKVIGLFTFFFASLVTFLFFAAGTDAGSVNVMALNFQLTDSLTQEKNTLTSFWNAIAAFLSVNQFYIVMVWAVGVFIFSLRFVGGVFYLKYLRGQAFAAEREWKTTLQRLSKKLGLARAIDLCESLHVSTPVVIGYLKPVVLMPIGLLSGLSTQQVEVILIHELAHIRRHDYLINFIQSLGETIFFFNPFVWMLSASIRTERENCCDDVVIEQGYDPKLYVNTLLEVENARQQNTRLALALTGDKNLLLNRIKRIMERSVKTQNGREKFIPVLLLVLGLVLASWLSIESSRKIEDGNMVGNNLRAVAFDTAAKPHVERYSRKSVITYDEKGNPHEEITEDISGDEVEFIFVPDAPVAFEVPDFPEVFEIPELDEFASFNMHMDVPFAPIADTLPEMTEFWIKDEARWKEFEKQFSEEFKVKFGDFYAKNGKEVEKMMAEVEKRMSRFDDEWAADVSMRMSDKMLKAQAEFERMAPIAQEQMAKIDMKMKDLEANFHIDEEAMRRAEAEMRREEGRMRDMEREMRDFEATLQDELVKDGYLKAGDKISTINFTGEGIKVNGMKVKEKDQQKYLELQQKFMKSKKRYNRVE